jgi:hypothetical protein
MFMLKRRTLIQQHYKRKLPRKLNGKRTAQALLLQMKYQRTVKSMFTLTSMAMTLCQTTRRPLIQSREKPSSTSREGKRDKVNVVSSSN